MAPETDAHKDLIEKRLALPEELKPPPRNQINIRFRKGHEAAENLIPMDHVPSGLRTFRVGRHLQPPMMCFGWPMSVEQLVRLAETKGFLGRTTTDKSASAVSLIDISDTQHLFHHVIRDELGISCITPEIRAIVPKESSKDHVALLCLSTTYNEDWEHPPQEDVSKIAAYLGIDEVPKWYLDYEQGKWAFRTFRRFPLPHDTYKYGLVRYKGVNEGGCPHCKIRPL